MTHKLEDLTHKIEGQPPKKLGQMGSRYSIWAKYASKTSTKSAKKWPPPPLEYPHPFRQSPRPRPARENRWR